MSRFELTPTQAAWLSEQMKDPTFKPADIARERRIAALRALTHEAADNEVEWTVDPDDLPIA